MRNRVRMILTIILILSQASSVTFCYTFPLAFFHDSAIIYSWTCNCASTYHLKEPITMNATTIYTVMETKNAAAVQPDGFHLLPISRTDGKKGKSGLCIQAPVVSESMLTVAFNDAVGKEWFAAQIAALQSRIASAANKAGQAITSETIGISALLVAMKGEEQAARISKESIGAWFDAGMLPLLTAALVAKNVPEGAIAKIAEAFKGVFCKLAQREVSLTDAEAEQLTKALALIPEDSELAEDSMTEKLAVRLGDAMERGNSIANAL